MMKHLANLLFTFLIALPFVSQPAAAQTELLSRGRVYALIVQVYDLSRRRWVAWRGPHGMGNGSCSLCVQCLHRC